MKNELLFNFYQLLITKFTSFPKISKNIILYYMLTADLNQSGKNLAFMDLLNQIFPPWHIYLDVLLVGVGLYSYLRITKKINRK